MISLFMTGLFNSALAEDSVSPNAEKKEAAVEAAEETTEKIEKEESKDETNEENSSAKVVVIHASLEETLTRAKTLAALRNAGMKDLEPDDLNLIMLNDFIRSGGYQSLNGADLVTCGTTPTSLSRLRNMIQQAENEVSYLEFEKAEGTLRTAEQALNCLKDFADSELAFQLYFFQGIVLFDNGNEAGAREAFHQALTFMPTKRWDDYFAPDAKPLFDEIKEEIVKSKEKTLTIVPTPARDSIWIDGFPADGNTHMLKPGAHLIQINTGEKTNSYRVRISDEDATFVVPAALSPDALGWVRDTEKSSELSTVAGAIAEQNKGAVMVNGSEVWNFDTEMQKLTELEVPRSLYISGRDPKVVSAWSLAGTGSLAMLSGATMMAVSANKANGYADQASKSDSFNDFEEASLQYNETRGLYNVYRGVFIGGTTITAASAAMIYVFKNQ